MNSQEEQNLVNEYGFELKPDRARGAGWYTFVKGNVHVWFCLSQLRPQTPWAVSVLQDGRYTQHEYFPTLEKALKTANQKQ